MFKERTVSTLTEIYEFFGKTTLATGVTRRVLIFHLA